jgi:hypothetical protein
MKWNKWQLVGREDDRELWRCDDPDGEAAAFFKGRIFIRQSGLPTQTPAPIIFEAENIALKWLAYGAVVDRGRGPAPDRMTSRNDERPTI